MDETKFITAIKKFPCLYDKKCNDPSSKEKAWATVALMVDQNEETCIKKWKSIRDHFKKHYNRYKIRKEEEGESAAKPVWKHFEQMQFMNKIYDASGKASVKKPKKDKNSFEVTTPTKPKRKLPDEMPSAPSSPSPVKKVKSSPEDSFVEVRPPAFPTPRDTMDATFLSCREPTQIDYDSVANSFGNLVSSKLKTFDPVTAEEAMKHIFNHLWSI